MKPHEKLRRIIKAKGVRPTTLAAMVEVDPSQVSQWLSGHRSPSFDSMVKLSQALKFSLDDFAENKPCEPMAEIDQEILALKEEALKHGGVPVIRALRRTLLAFDQFQLLQSTSHPEEEDVQKKLAELREKTDVLGKKKSA